MEILDIEAAVSSSAHLVLRVVKFDTVGPTISYFNVCIALLFMRRTRCPDEDTAALTRSWRVFVTGNSEKLTVISQQLMTKLLDTLLTNVHCSEISLVEQ